MYSDNSNEQQWYFIKVLTGNYSFETSTVSSNFLIMVQSWFILRTKPSLITQGCKGELVFPKSSLTFQWDSTQDHN